MEEKKTILLKLWSGCMVIGTFVQFTNDRRYELKDPRMVAMMPMPGGSVRVALASVSEPFAVKRLKEELLVPESQVMFALGEDEIEKDMVSGYKSEVAGIRLATAADAAKLAGKAAPGEIVL